MHHYLIGSARDGRTGNRSVRCRGHWTLSRWTGLTDRVTGLTARIDLIGRVTGLTARTGLTKSVLGRTCGCPFYMK